MGQRVQISTSGLKFFQNRAPQYQKVPLATREHPWKKTSGYLEPKKMNNCARTQNLFFFERSVMSWWLKNFFFRKTKRFISCAKKIFFEPKKFLFFFVRETRENMESHFHHCKRLPKSWINFWSATTNIIHINSTQYVYEEGCLRFINPDLK